MNSSSRSLAWLRWQQLVLYKDSHPVKKQMLRYPGMNIGLMRVVGLLSGEQDGVYYTPGIFLGVGTQQEAEQSALLMDLTLFGDK